LQIVGTGISGLVAAHLLHRQHELVVYEAGARVGGHSHTVEVESEDGNHWIDTGFVVFNDRNYPNFERLLDERGVASQPSHMSFSVSDGRDFEYSGTPRGLFARPSHLLRPSFFGMLRDWPFQPRGPGADRPQRRRVEAVVADVNNITWGERHPYVLARGTRRGAVLADELDKTLHVSPLMGMDQAYTFRASEPGDRLSVHIESRPVQRADPPPGGQDVSPVGGGKAFDATLSLRRRELSRARLAGMLGAVHRAAASASARPTSTASGRRTTWSR
jgi:hypothetical protein